MKINVRHASVLLSLVALIVYLFVSAPAPLPQGKAGAGEATVPVRVLFEVLAAEQAAARSLYTREVVGAGMKQGLKFSEEWKKPEMEAGPLPALLLREVSQRLQASGSGVGLFLGSDFPIATVNRFQGMQVERFELIKKSKQPEFFKDPSNGIQTAMFIDPASARRAHEAGQGATIDFSLGAISGLEGHVPVRGRFRVERIGDGQFTCTGPMFRGFRMNLGPMALLRSEAAPGVQVVLATRKCQAADQEMFRHLGIEPQRQRIVALKSSVHFRADFQPIAREVLVVQSPGPCLADPVDFAWTRLRPGLRMRPFGPRFG